jgi:hypothetical protein
MRSQASYTESLTVPRDVVLRAVAEMVSPMPAEHPRGRLVERLEVIPE